MSLVNAKCRPVSVFLALSDAQSSFSVCGCTRWQWRVQSTTRLLPWGLMHSAVCQGCCLSCAVAVTADPSRNQLFPALLCLLLLGGGGRSQHS